MPPRRLQIPDLAAKLDFLALNTDARRINGCSGLNDLARRCGIKVPTLKGAKNVGLLSPDHEQLLAKYCGFDASADAWRKGKVEEFKDYYLHTAKCRKNEQQTQAANIPLKCVDCGEPESAEPRLAALEMFTQQGNAENPWPLSFHLICRAAPVGDAVVAIQRGYIDLDCGTARAPKADWLGFRATHELPGAKVSIHVAPGTEQKPSWQVVAKEGGLGNVLPDEAYCVLSEVAAGNIVSVSFTIYVKDVKSAPGICQEDGKPFGRNRQAILDRMAAKALPGGREGWAVLCRHRVLFVAVESEADQLPGKVTV